MTIRPASDRSYLITLGSEISLPIHREVRRVTCALAGLRGLLNLHPAYTSVLVDFDPRRISPAEFESAMRRRIETAREETLPHPREIEIPVHYGGADGPDLDDVARLTGLTTDEVVAAHSAAEYLVYFLGFSPGFPYLGGLPPQLAVPRLDSPRRHVPAGSVAIGGAQTGVYPVASPGGWRVIGRTPLALFRPAADPPTLLQMGDRVRFVPVDRERV